MHICEALSSLLQAALHQSVLHEGPSLTKHFSFILWLSEGRRHNEIYSLMCCTGHFFFILRWWPPLKPSIWQHCNTTSLSLWRCRMLICYEPKQHQRTSTQQEAVPALASAQEMSPETLQASALLPLNSSRKVVPETLSVDSTHYCMHVCEVHFCCCDNRL